MAKDFFICPTESMGPDFFGKDGQRITDLRTSGLSDTQLSRVGELVNGTRDKWESQNSDLAPFEREKHIAKMLNEYFKSEGVPISVKAQHHKIEQTKPECRHRNARVNLDKQREKFRPYHNP